MAPSELTAAPELDTIRSSIRPNIPKQQKLDPIADPPVNVDSSINVTKTDSYSPTARSIPSYLVQSSRTWYS